MHQQPLVIGYIFKTLVHPFRFAEILVAVDEVGNDFNVLLDIENIKGAIAQILRDRGHAVALLNGKARYGKV